MVVEIGEKPVDDEGKPLPGKVERIVITSDNFDLLKRLSFAVTMRAIQKNLEETAALIQGTTILPLKPCTVHRYR